MVHRTRRYQTLLLQSLFSKYIQWHDDPRWKHVWIAFAIWVIMRYVSEANHRWLQGFVRIYNICLISEGIKLQPHTWISSSPPSLPVTPHTSKSTHTPLSISFPIIICSSPSLPILPPYPLRCSMGCRITHSRKNNYLIFGKWNFLRTNLTDRTMLTLENIGKLFRMVRENIWFSADLSCNSVRLLPTIPGPAEPTRESLRNHRQVPRAIHSGVGRTHYQDGNVCRASKPQQESGHAWAGVDPSQRNINEDPR